ncbi:hypothetical protein LWF15_00370 [Kineosporia rhizophila]|uniref:hypothetical protein n=1 Tax=Kineosporia rhizophila TaxID=84633 RepID=UPI001E2F9759|nr:hypothetical protein [Kineosporia rhizophila]MCE0533958.1 hypothetical protein [Kineosporia rhizophila]
MSRPRTILSHGRRPSQTPRRNGSSEGNRRVPGLAPKRRLKHTALVASALSLPLLLSGCSMEWASMSPSVSMAKTDVKSVASVTKPSPTATPSASSTPAATASTDPFADGELAEGSLKHSKPVGDHALVIIYWTDGTSTDVYLSAELEGADREHAVKVTRFAATLSSDGTETPLADDQGEFVLTPPFSYTSALALPAGTAETGTTLDIRFDLLVETAPGSGAFYRQTVLDTVALNAGSTRSSSEVVSEGAAQ